MSTLYVFALVDRPPDPFRVKGHRIEFTPVGRVHAAVEWIGARPDPSETALRTQHDIVAQIAARVDAILPARFGSYVDAEELERIVSLRRDAVQQALDLVRCREQMTVRLFAPAGKSGEPVDAPVEERATSGTHYLQGRRAATVARPLPAALIALSAAVRDIVVAERSEPGYGRVAGTLYHLIDRGNAPRYREALATAGQRPAEETLSVSGPWPPFAFAPELWP